MIQRRTLGRRAAALAAAVAVTCATVATIGAAGSRTAVAADDPPSAGPTITGAACAPDVGVTVVVDWTGLRDEVEVACAPGAQADGFAALEAAGFSFNEGEGIPAGIICQIEGLPTEGYPFCWTDGGFWSYWLKTADTEWGFASYGAGGGPTRPVNAVEGWSWAPGFNGAAPRADETFDGVAPVVTIDHAPPATTTEATVTVEFTVDDPQATITCSTDDAPAEPCTSPHSVTVTEPGDHELVITATDTAGNAGHGLVTWTLADPDPDPDPVTCGHDLPGVGGRDEALRWLACELASVGRFGSTYDGTYYVDVGLTLDAVLAFASYDHAPDLVADTFAALGDDLVDYVTGFGEPDDRSAGATAKTLLATRLTGAGAGTAIADLDLDADLRSLLGGGEHPGRFVDRNAFADYSNGFTQALAIMALSHSPDGVPAPAMEFLLLQQCPGGGFRGAYVTTVGCQDDAEADTDYTAIALQALLTASAQPQVAEAADRAARWLIDRQDPVAGGIGGTGLAAGLNTNSSGLAAQALRGAGRAEVADQVADWITTLQRTAERVGADGTDRGAIAYVAGSFDAALTEGLTANTRDQWRRATAQAVLAFGAAPFGAEAPPVLDEPAVALDRDQAAVGDSVTVTVAGFTADQEVTVALHSDPVDLGRAAVVDGVGQFTFTVPATVAGAHEVVVTGATSGQVARAPLTVTAATTPTTTVGSPDPTVPAANQGTPTGPTGSTSRNPLARTGADLVGLAALAGMALAAGGALTRRERTTRR